MSRTTRGSDAFVAASRAAAVCREHLPAAGLITDLVAALAWVDLHPDHESMPRAVAPEEIPWQRG